MAGEGLNSSPGQNSNGSPNGSPLQYRVNNYTKCAHANSDLVKGLNNTDLSPYNSKFTVLRFSKQKSNLSQGKTMTPNLRPFELSPGPDAVMSGQSENALANTTN